MLNEVLEAGNFGKHDARNRFGRSKLGHNLSKGVSGYKTREVFSSRGAMRTFVPYLALLLEDEEQEIIDIKNCGIPI